MRVSGVDGSVYAGDWSSGRRHGSGVRLTEAGLFEVRGGFFYLTCVRACMLRPEQGDFRNNAAQRGILTLGDGSRTMQELSGEAVIRAAPLERDGGTSAAAVKKLQATCVCPARCTVSIP
jgi:hypothetical protein